MICRFSSSPGSSDCNADNPRVCVVHFLRFPATRKLVKVLCNEPALDPSIPSESQEGVALLLVASCSGLSPGGMSHLY